MFISRLIKNFEVVFINCLKSAGEKLTFPILMFFLCDFKTLNLSKCDSMKRNIHFSLFVFLAKDNKHAGVIYLHGPGLHSAIHVAWKSD